MEFTENDLPVRFHHEEMLRLADGTVVRFETSGEAKDIYIGDTFSPTTQLFPECDFTFVAGGNTYTILAHFEDYITVSRG